MICAYCSEPILDGEERMRFNGGAILMHRNCGLRGVVGSVAHLQKQCACYKPGSTAGDPEGTLRQAADAAVAEWKRSVERGGLARLPCCGSVV